MSTDSAKTTLRNTGLVGGSQVISMIIGIVKTKVAAILLGPSGMGIIQLFTSSINLIQSISSLGIGFSGVRDVSESIGSGDNEKVAKTIITLKRWTWATGILGVIITVIFSKQLSYWAFDNEDYWIEISILSLTIFFANINASYGAIIRGARRMGDYVKVNLWSAFLGAIISIVLYYFFKEKGIVPSLITSGLIILIANFYYAKKIKLIKVKVGYKESITNGLGMIKLGIYTVLTGFVSNSTLYYVRVSISNNLGLDAVGYYAAATTLTLTYMGVIFTTMSADYFPKVSAINNDDREINQAILEQTNFLLLLGTPLIIAMFTFSEYIIQVLYSNKFISALPLMMWLLLSIFLRFINLPIGYVFLAKGKGKIFIFTQSFWNVIFLALVFFSWKILNNLEGIGIAYILANILAMVVNVFIIKKQTGLIYEKNILKNILILSIIIALYFSISYFFKGFVIFIFKIIGLIALVYYSFKEIEKLIAINIIDFIRLKLKKK